MDFLQSLAPYLDDFSESPAVALTLILLGLAVVFQGIGSRRRLRRTRREWEARAGQLEGVHQRLGESLAALEVGLQSLQRGQREDREGVAELQKELRAVTGRMAVLGMAADDWEQKLDALRDEVAGWGQGLSALESRLGGGFDQLRDEFRRVAAETEARVSDLAGQAMRMGVQLNSQDEVTRAIAARLAGLEGAVPTDLLSRLEEVARRAEAAWRDGERLREELSEIESRPVNRLADGIVEAMTRSPNEAPESWPLWNGGQNN